MPLRTMFSGREGGAERAETASSEKRNGLLHAVLLDGKGGLVRWPNGEFRTTDWADVEDWETWKEQPALWIHLDAYQTPGSPQPYTHQWLQENLNKTNTRDVDQMFEHLIDEDAEPKFRETGQGFILVLRGIDYRPPKKKARQVFARDLEKRYDLNPLNCWVQPSRHRLITVRPGSKSLIGIQNYLRECENGTGAASLGLLLAELALSVCKDITRVIKDLTNLIAELEKDPFTQKVGYMLDELAVIRRQAIVLETHMTPQHLALDSILADYTATAKFLRASNPVFEPYKREEPSSEAGISGDTSRTGKRIEDPMEAIMIVAEALRVRLKGARESDDPIDALHDSIRITKEYEGFAANLRERAAGVQHSITSIATAQFSRQAWVLSLVATITLPLTLFTAIVSVNLGGMFEGRAEQEFWDFLWALGMLLAGLIFLFWFVQKRIISLDASGRRRRRGQGLEKASGGI